MGTTTLTSLHVLGDVDIDGILTASNLQTFDQSLNTTDSVNFNSVTAMSSPGGPYTRIEANDIVFESNRKFVASIVIENTLTNQSIGTSSDVYFSVLANSIKVINVHPTQNTTMATTVDNLVDRLQVAGSILSTSAIKGSGFNDTSISVDASNGLTAKTISTRNTNLTGTTGASLAFTLPTLTTNDNGAKYHVMSTVARAAVTWSGTTVGLPTALVDNTPITIQYNHSNTTWYIAG